MTDQEKLKNRTLRTSDAEWENWKREAEKDGRDLSNWIRRQCNNACENA